MSKIKNGRLDHYGTGPFERQQFGPAGAEGVNRYYSDSVAVLMVSVVQIGEVTSCGVTGGKAQFTINLPVHSLSFSSQVTALLCIVLCTVWNVV